MNNKSLGQQEQAKMRCESGLGLAAMWLTQTRDLLFPACGGLALVLAITKVDVFAIARPAMDGVLPVGIVFDALKTNRSCREFPQHLRVRTSRALRIRMRLLYFDQEFALQSIPLLLRCFAFHTRSIVPAPAERQGLRPAKRTQRSELKRDFAPLIVLSAAPRCGRNRWF